MTDFRLKAQIVFRDGSLLHIRQIILGEAVYKYAFHWQDATGQLLCRWENAPHWPETVTHPHHKHVMREQYETVTELRGGDFEVVFEEIIRSLPQLGKKAPLPDRR
uniref:Uncharacterized protein n=1 Tax=Candidatus Kentrum sp. SD TaxID=2126332 RepID=A0A450Z1T6_9GAMM|nr:MAG: hypothetical protein BECKSD772F_GA0070984_11075 [Candidatus Kentron sp. SD]VFK47761.1 MAG: hypothetical protein BECKSD772E_GA0070983_11055 [Candidatus Kentron sp. SD]